jgi:microsomal dipeptidase-like Zn-dependent dipeptidase
MTARVRWAGGPFLRPENDTGMISHIQPTGVFPLNLTIPQSKLGLIFGFQRASMLGEQLHHIELFRNLGVRIMQLSYNDRSLYGDGCLEPANGGLSFLGRQAVAEMNRVGVAVDLSHCGQKTTADGIQTSKRPALNHTQGAVLSMHIRAIRTTQNTRDG